MKKLAFYLFGILAALSIREAAAEPSNLYVRIDGGGSFPSDSSLGGLDHFDPSGMIGAGVGFRMLPFLRTDVTVSYRPSYGQSTTDPSTGLLQKSEIKNLSGFFNAYVDIPTGTPLTPYLGAGIGAARNEVGTTTITDGVNTLAVNGATKTNLAFQAMAGVSFPVFVGAAVDIGYHYLDAGRFTSSSNGSLNGVAGTVSPLTGKLKAHEVQVGLRIGF